MRPSLSTSATFQLLQLHIWASQVRHHGALSSCRPSSGHESERRKVARGSGWPEIYAPLSCFPIGVLVSCKLDSFISFFSSAAVDVTRSLMHAKQSYYYRVTSQAWMILVCDPHFTTLVPQYAITGSATSPFQQQHTHTHTQHP